MPAPPRPADESDDDRPFLIPESDGPAAVSRPAPTANAPSGTPLASAPVPPVAFPARREPAARPALPSVAPARDRKKLLAAVVDLVAVLVLLAGGAFLGEMLAGKSTREVWEDAGSSVTFPPTDLLMWLAPPVLLALVYALLISRGKSFGARLK